MLTPGSSNSRAGGSGVITGCNSRSMTTSSVDWPDTRLDPRPSDDPYASATWLLGRHPRLARLAARIDGVVSVDNGDLSIDIDHLATVIASTRRYRAAWEDYERRVRPPDDDRAYDRWLEGGPKSEDFPRGMTDFLVMSSGEVASLRLLATLASTDCAPPFSVAHLRSMDEEGQRLVADWCAVVVAY